LFLHVPRIVLHEAGYTLIFLEYTLEGDADANQFVFFRIPVPAFRHILEYAVQLVNGQVRPDGKKHRQGQSRDADADNHDPDVPLSAGYIPFNVFLADLRYVF
jgi:hypothetical protein